MTGYVQIAKIDYALKGTIVMSGFPLPPLCDMLGSEPEAAKKNATYYGQDMNWMIWIGEKDEVFPANFTLTYWNGVFAALEVPTALKIEHTEPAQDHELIKVEF